MAQTRFLQPRPIRGALALDATRIGASASAIAINAGLMLVLLAPMAPRITEEIKRDELQIVPIRRVEPRPVLPPQPQPVDTRVAKPSSAPDPRPRIAPPAFEAVSPSARDVPTQAGDVEDMPPAGDDAQPDAADRSPAVGAALQALSAPPPPYPRDALRKRLQGTVVLDVHVGSDGRPVQVLVVTSSGHRALDRAAQQQVMRAWRFRPAMLDGRPVPALGRVPVAFVLED